jgi:hypothetical protein
VKSILAVAVAVITIVVLFALFVTTAESSTKDRRCFDAGGRVVDGACMPIDGAISFPSKESQ